LHPTRILRVPGSSANLGPGFDALGVALEVYLECRFSISNRLSIRVSGRDSDLISPREDNMIWQTALAVAARAHMTLPPISLEIVNDIPIGKGLGSSAAALTAGVVIAEDLSICAGSLHAFWTKRRGSKGIPIMLRRACWGRLSRVPWKPAA